MKENKRADVARRWSDVRVGEQEMTTLSLRARWRPSAECLIKIAMRTLHGNMLELTRRGGTQNAACDAAELLSQALSVVRREQSGTSCGGRKERRRALLGGHCRVARAAMHGTLRYISRTLKTVKENPGFSFTPTHIGITLSYTTFTTGATIECLYPLPKRIATLR